MAVFRITCLCLLWRFTFLDAESGIEVEAAIVVVCRLRVDMMLCLRLYNNVNSILNDTCWCSVDGIFFLGVGVKRLNARVQAWQALRGERQSEVYFST